MCTKEREKEREGGGGCRFISNAFSTQSSLVTSGPHMSIYSMDNLMIGAPPQTSNNQLLRGNRVSSSTHQQQQQQQQQQRYNCRTPSIMVMGQDPGVGSANMTTGSLSSPRSPRLKLTPASPDNAGPALARLGKSISLSVEMLATVGETVGDENPEIRGDMVSACRESRAVSGALEKLCESLSRGARGMSNAQVGVLLHAPTPPPAPAPSGSGLPPEADLEALLRTLRRLLVSVTQILLLADNVVVKQLLTVSKDKGPANDLNTMSTMHHFTEFVKAFCDFGSEMNSTVRIATGTGTILNFSNFVIQKNNLYSS